MLQMTKPLLAILLLLPLSLSAREGPDWMRMGKCSARYVLALEIIQSLSVDILAVELAERIDTPGDAFLAGVEYASEKQSVLHSGQIMSVDMGAEVAKNLNLKELLRLNCHEYLPKDE